MRSIFLLLIVAGLLLNGCSTGPTYRNPRYPNYPNYPPNYPGYPSPSPYPGGPGGGYGYEQLRTMADSLDLATDKLEQDSLKAETSLGSDTLSKIQTLRDEAKTFLQRVDDASMGPGRTDNNFQGLLKAYYATKDVIRNLQDQRIQEDFDRVTRMMRSIANFYGYRLDRNETQDPMIR